MHNQVFRTIQGMVAQIDDDGCLTISSTQEQLNNWNRLGVANKIPKVKSKKDKIQYLLERGFRSFRIFEELMRRKNKVNEIGLDLIEDKEKLTIKIDFFLMTGIEKSNVKVQKKILIDFFDYCTEVLTKNYIDFATVYINRVEKNDDLGFHLRDKKSPVELNKELKAKVRRSKTLTAFIDGIKNEMKRMKKPNTYLDLDGLMDWRELGELFDRVHNQK